MGWGLGTSPRGGCSRPLWLEGKVSSRNLLSRGPAPRAPEAGFAVTCHWGPSGCDQVPSGRIAPWLSWGGPLSRSPPAPGAQAPLESRDGSPPSTPSPRQPLRVGGRMSWVRAPPTDAETAYLPPPLIVVAPTRHLFSGNHPAELAVSSRRRAPSRWGPGPPEPRAAGLPLAHTRPGSRAAAGRREEPPGELRAPPQPQGHSRAASAPPRCSSSSSSRGRQFGQQEASAWGDRQEIREGTGGRPGPSHPGVPSGLPRLEDFPVGQWEEFCPRARAAASACEAALCSSPSVVSDSAARGL